MTTTMNQKTELTVATIIAQQIGARAFFMMGTRNKLGDSTSLIFDVRGSQAVNKIRITLDVTDTYTLEFIKVRGLASRLVASHSGVYADMLHAMIEKETGLYLSL